MNRFIKSSSFKYLKNFIIGFGASVVMIGALGKIRSYPWGDAAITAGLLTEAFLFLMLGIIPPEKDYYWENSTQVWKSTTAKSLRFLLVNWIKIPVH